MLIRILDFIFPPRAETLMVRTLSARDIPYLYTETRVHDAIALSDFRNPQIRALIHEAKFHDNTHAHELLGKLFAVYWKELPTPFDVVIPIPLSQKRERARGYNQVQKILECSAHEVPVPLDTTCLTRVRHTTPQTNLPKEARLKNLHGAFSVINPQTITGKRILIVDDVLTTGTTLHTAQVALAMHNPISIRLLALAH